MGTMRSRFEEAKRRAMLRAEEARLAKVEAKRAAAEYHSSVMSLMGSEAVAPGCEVGDGFLIFHEVRVTEAWRPSLVRLDERPRVRPAKGSKTCAHCGQGFMGHGKARFCGGTCRVAAYRAAHK